MATLSTAPHDAVGHALTCDRVSGPIPLPAWVRMEDRTCQHCGRVLAWTLEQAIGDYMTVMGRVPHTERQEAARIRLNGLLSPGRTTTPEKE